MLIVAAAAIKPAQQSATGVDALSSCRVESSLLETPDEVSKGSSSTPRRALQGRSLHYLFLRLRTAELKETCDRRVSF